MKRVVVAALLVVVACVLWRNRSSSIVGADRSGYVNLSSMFARGERALPLPASCAQCQPYWFTPLGFVASPDGKTMSAVYPPGMPLHLLVTEAVSPIAGVVLILLTFLLGRRLHSELAGLIGAVLLSFCAVFVFESLQLMSDVLAAMWSVAAVLTAVWCGRG
ncbi:MAG TPA: hypothetical protein VND45_09820, partial [Thermoanaerobaculia bacterium]|nr:hypothetical protein [Thermoanaerobaculia bacterium]